MTTHSGRSVVIAFTLWGVIVRTTRIEKKKVKNRLIIDPKDLVNEFKNNTNEYILGKN